MQFFFGLLLSYNSRLEQFAIVQQFFEVEVEKLEAADENLNVIHYIYTAGLFIQGVETLAYASTAERLRGMKLKNYAKGFIYTQAV